MEKPNILELAKQGNPQAIAALLNRQLQPKGITVQADLQDACLQVVLEAEQVPNQRVLVDSIRKGVTGLGATSIERVKISGRQTGDELSAWSQEFELITQVKTPSIAPEVVSPSPTNPSVTAPRPTVVHQEKKLNLFKEFLEDITERKDQDSILGGVALVLSLIFILVGFSTTSVFNLLLILNLFLVGWVLRAGYNELQQGASPKLIVIGGISFLLCLLKIWQLSEAIAQLSALRNNLLNF